MTTPIGDIPNSSIPVVRAYLLSGLTATIQPDPSGQYELLVRLDEPGTYLPDDIVYVGKVHQVYNPESVMGSGGRNWLTETYTVDVCVSIFRGGDDSESVFNRARSITDLIIAFVRSDPSFGGAVDRARPSMVTHDSEWDDDAKGRRCDIEISIDILNSL